jgi:hypothetical protein
MFLKDKFAEPNNFAVRCSPLSEHLVAVNQIDADNEITVIFFMLVSNYTIQQSGGLPPPSGIYCSTVLC